MRTNFSPMTDIHLDLTETTIDGPRTRRWVLDVGAHREFAAHRIARVGIEDAVAPYRRIRIRPAGSFLMACLAGRGRVLLDGRWQTIGAGTVCMAPPRVLNAFAALPGQTWRFCWVRYEEPPHVKPLVSAASPVRVRSDVESVRCIFEGLRAEWTGAKDAKLLHHWTELLHGQVRRLAQPWQVDERLWKLWEEVARELTAPWDLDSLARRFHSSKEQLRRLCLRELGRSPMQHLTGLRMQRAQELIETTADKLETIAPLVGYESALVFSRAFKRWIGTSPSEYRGRGK